MDGPALFAEVFNFLGGQSCLQAAADDGDGGGHGTVFPNNALHIQGSFHILGVGHAVGNDGGLQGDNGFAFGNGLGDFGVDIQIAVPIHMIVSFPIQKLQV